MGKFLNTAQEHIITSMYKKEAVLQIKNFSVSVEGDDFYISGPIFDENTDEEIPLEMLKRDMPKMIYKEVRVEHEAPELDPYSLIGEVDKVWINDADNRPWARAKIGNDSQVEKDIRKELLEDQTKPEQERKWKGFSSGLMKFYNNEGIDRKLKKIFPRELTLTKEPVCEPCTIRTVSRYSMANQPNSLDLAKGFEQVLSSTVDRVNATFSKQIEVIENNYKRQIAEYSATIKTQQDTIAQQKKELDDREISINSLTKKVEDLTSSNLTLQSQVDNIDKVPLVEDIIKLMQYGKNVELADAKRKELMVLKKEEIQRQLEDYTRFLKLYSRAQLPILGSQQVEQTPAIGSPMPNLQAGSGGGAQATELGGF